jgi:hypothetical protein
VLMGWLLGRCIADCGCNWKRVSAVRIRAAKTFRYA